MQIDFNRYKKDKKTNKAIVALHGWGGNKDSFLPFSKNIKIHNAEWFLPEAPYLIKDAPPISPDDSQDNDLCRKSWTYKKEDGMWELNEPIDILNDFFDNIIFV